MLLCDPMKGKKAILVELTVLWEEKCEEAQERKQAKYEHLVQHCGEKGWLIPSGRRVSGIPSQVTLEVVDQVCGQWPDEKDTSLRGGSKKKPPVGFDIIGSMLDAWRRPTSWRVLWLRVKTLNEGWVPPDDLQAKAI